MNYKKKYKFQKKIMYSAAVSIAVYILLIYIMPFDKFPVSMPSYTASQKMAKAMSVLRNYLNEKNISINKKTDPNLTGLIGTHQTELTTSLGHLEAKRTTTNPNFAGLIVHLLTESGVHKNDKVAIGSSASFPALMIASVCGVEAIGATPITILSLGSSSYGANDPGFNLLHIYEVLLQEKVFSHQAAAISLGGENDIGENMNNQIKQQLINQIRKSDIPFIFENTLRKSVQQRLHIYKKEADPEEISAFINCGGSLANLGTSSLILRLEPGLIHNAKIPEENNRGVLFEMTSQGIPCIHLLYIKGLVRKYNLEWDPVPLPRPKGYSGIELENKNSIILLITGVVYLAILAFIINK